MIRNRATFLTPLMVLLPLLFIGSCRKTDMDTKYLSWGNIRTLYVLADPDIWKDIDSTLTGSLERVVFTTEEETWFDVSRAGYSEIQKRYKYKNLVMVATLDSNGEVSKYVRSMLDSETLQRIGRDGRGIFLKDDLFARDQRIVFLLAKDQATLNSHVQASSDKLFDLFSDITVRRVSAGIRALDALPVKTYAAFPWTLHIPKYFRLIFRNDPANRFISFLARSPEKPDRWVSVYFEDMKDSLDLQAWMLDRRTNLVWKYYDQDVFDPAKVSVDTCYIDGLKGLKLTGRWENRKHFVGGPFQSFGLIDPVRKKVFLIDNTVFYPQGPKLESLLQLEAISRTWRYKR